MSPVPPLPVEPDPCVNFADQLEEAVGRVQTPALIGLDPHLHLLPEPFAAARRTEDPEERADLVCAFLDQVLDVVAGRVAAVKPQSAFFEALGAPGARVWEHVVRRAHDHDLLVIGDVKRGDIASTAEAYATAFLEGLPGTDPDTLCDAVTLNPFLGAESIEPFLAACDRTGRGLYVLVRTSNPGRADFQMHGEPELSQVVAAAVDRWGSRFIGACGLSSVGAVVGATSAHELSAWRERLPRTPFLLPGYGAQGATADDNRGAFLPPAQRGRMPRGALVNSSRAILFAWRDERYASAHGLRWKDATDAALQAMIADFDPGRVS